MTVIVLKINTDIEKLNLHDLDEVDMEHNLMPMSML